MKDSVKKSKLSRKDLEELDWGYDDKPHREKIRRRKRKYDGEEAPSKRKENVRKREKS